MARIYPFAALRYDPAKAGRLENVITQPYDKISPEMLERYRSLSPYNLARIIKTSDYAGAAGFLGSWLREGVLRRDTSPAIYPYFQTYQVPGSSAAMTRRGFIAAVGLEDYSAGVVYRHEQTLTGPKQDRLQLLRATRAHFGQLFMLYSDPAGAVDAMLETASKGEPIERLCDEYGAEHRVWRVDDTSSIDALQRAMADKKLLIADGHHRYETALAFRDECRRSSVHKPGGRCEAVMMTLVNMDGPGVTILPTHRVLAQWPDFDKAKFLASIHRHFDALPMDPEEGRVALGRYEAGQAIGLAVRGRAQPEFYLLVLRPEADLAALLPGIPPPQRRLDVVVLHQLLLRECLGIDEQAVRDEKFLRYVRGFENGWEAVTEGAPACFFLNPVPVGQMSEVAFSGGVLPQKSTDFYPKLLSGLTGYTVED